ncbi:MAG: hypothetical protein NTX36_11250 [Proteobacteria bacterium]|nr:hypothetical protein [Pseudomonadota bacterium]
MQQTLIREKVIEELRKIPEKNLGRIYEFIKNFSTEEPSPKTAADKIMAFAGSWKDMGDDLFSDLTRELSERRKQAFMGRREK